MRFDHKPKNPVEEFTQKAVERYLRRKHSDYWMDYAYEQFFLWNPVKYAPERMFYQTMIVSEDPDITDAEGLLVKIDIVIEDNKTWYEATIYRYDNDFEETEEI